MASLERGVGALAVASGQAAQFIAITSLLEAGDEIVASKALYGGTYTQFDVSFRRLGIQTTFVDPDDPENFRARHHPADALDLWRDDRKSVDERVGYRGHGGSRA